MKIFAVFLAVLAVTAASVQEEWTSYKTSFGKQYFGEEEEIRLSIWEANKELVEAHNAAGHSYTLGMTEFADWTTEEFEEKMFGYKHQDTPDSQRKTFEPVPNAPTDLDYRDDGKVTPVKNQGQCGSCWAFSATGALEGLWKKEKGELVSLSEQQMVDCGEGSCQGGWMYEGWKTSYNGIQSEGDYPYEAKNGQCRYDSNKQVAHCTGYQEIAKKEDDVESALVQVGHPISIAIHAGAHFQLYITGVYHDPLCKVGQLNHGVLLVGYNKSASTPYWIVKNSWGGSWGMKGYIHLKMGVNECGLDKAAMYPTL